LVKDKLIKTLTTPNLYIKTNNEERIILLKILKLLDIKVFEYTPNVIESVQNNNMTILFIYMNESDRKIYFSTTNKTEYIEFEDIIKDFKEYKKNE